MGGLRVALCTKRRAHQTLQEAHRSKAIQMQSLRQVREPGNVRPLLTRTSGDLFTRAKTWKKLNWKSKSERVSNKVLSDIHNNNSSAAVNPPFSLPLALSARSPTKTTTYVCKLVYRGDTRWMRGQGRADGTGGRGRGGSHEKRVQHVVERRGRLISRSQKASRREASQWSLRSSSVPSWRWQIMASDEPESVARGSVPELTTVVSYCAAE